MLKFGFGSKFKHRQFEYKPRYYDPIKDDLKERMAIYDKNTSHSIDETKERIKWGLRKKMAYDPELSKTMHRQSSIRTVYIILALSLITYTILMSDKIVQLFEVFSN